jgi:selenocysteine lyase/cysteine desulfurase
MLDAESTTSIRRKGKMKALGSLNDFPAADKSTYLNTASVALMYRDAEKAINNWQKDLAEFGTINFNEKAEQEVFDDLHVVFARLVGAQPEDIAVASSATELLASLAWAIAPGRRSNIVSTDIVFPSTLYPWARVARYTNCEVRLLKGENGHADQEELIRLIDDDTAVVCISHVEYGSGQRYDLGRIVESAHTHNALLVVDATQSAGAIPINAPASKVDALVSGGYKWLCGPFGVAVMYLAPHLQMKLDPGLVGFRSHKDIWDLQADRLVYPDNASRFEFSTMAYGCAIGLTQSIRYLLRVGVENILAHNLKLADLLIQGLEEMKAEIISPGNDEERTSIVSARFPGRHSYEIAQGLGEAGIVVSQRRDFVRFSPHLYNGTDDISRALEKLGQILVS